MANNFYPLPGFYFQLQFEGMASGMDNAFQEANGLTAEWEVEEKYARVAKTSTSTSY